MIDENIYRLIEDIKDFTFKKIDVIALNHKSKIIFVLDAILPEGTAKFINKYRYLIYPAGLALARWLDDKN